MITTCQFLKIYIGAIENSVDEIINEFKKINMDFEYTQDEILEMLEENGNWKNITNSIIGVLYSIAESLVLEKYPNAEIETFIDSYDSSFNIRNIKNLIEKIENEED